MQQSLTVVLERNTFLQGEFATEPYEVAWAREARWFVRALDVRGDGTTLRAVTQVSPDGLHWCDLDGEPHDLDAPGLASWPAREFGGWLRLKGTVNGGTGDDDAGVRVLVYLALKT